MKGEIMKIMKQNPVKNLDDKIPLLVTTAHRGVFFGYGRKSDTATIELHNARMCVYWSSALRGVLGLAASGPNKDCKIGPKVPSIVLREVTSITEVSPEAAGNWEKAFWV